MPERDRLCPLPGNGPCVVQYVGRRVTPLNRLIQYPPFKFYVPRCLSYFPPFRFRSRRTHASCSSSSETRRTTNCDSHSRVDRPGRPCPTTTSSRRRPRDVVRKDVRRLAMLTSRRPSLPSRLERRRSRRSRKSVRSY